MTAGTALSPMNNFTKIIHHRHHHHHLHDYLIPLKKTDTSANKHENTLLISYFLVGTKEENTLELCSEVSLNYRAKIQLK